MRQAVIVSLCALAGIAVASRANGADPKSASTKRATQLELTGCISLSRGASGQFSFLDGASGGEYRLTGKSVKKYAGQRVTLVADSSSKRPRFKFGLWPSPNVAAQAGALDPAQESIARQPGGSAHLPDAAIPELRVVRVQGADGSCE